MKTEPNEPITALTNDQWQFSSYYGLTKREYFAAMALSSLDVKSIFLDKTLETEVAKSAVRIADALIAELNKEQK